MSASRLARLAGVATVLASTAVVSTAVDASAVTCANGATFMVTLKTGVYASRSYPDGSMQHLIKYKYPGDIVDGTSIDGGSYLIVRLGTGGFGYMRGDKTVFNGCY